MSSVTVEPIDLWPNRDTLPVLRGQNPTAFRSGSNEQDHRNSRGLPRRGRWCLLRSVDHIRLGQQHRQLLPGWSLLSDRSVLRVPDGAGQLLPDG